MYCIEKVNMPEDFRFVLSQFMLVMRGAITEEIQKRGEKY